MKGPCGSGPLMSEVSPWKSSMHACDTHMRHERLAGNKLTGIHHGSEEGNVDALGEWASARKKIIMGVVVACLSICVFSGRTAAQERQWKFIKYEDSMFSYYDAEDVSYEDDKHVAGVWLKFLPVPGGSSYVRIHEDLKKMGIEKDYCSLIIRYEIDCPNSGGTQREMVCFDKNRSVIESITLPPGGRAIAIPPDIIEYVAKKVCARQED